MINNYITPYVTQTWNLILEIWTISWNSIFYNLEWFAYSLLLLHSRYNNYSNLLIRTERSGGLILFTLNNIYHVDYRSYLIISRHRFG